MTSGVLEVCLVTPLPVREAGCGVGIVYELVSGAVALAG